ncbi:uncharacterized protein DUF1566 [Methylomonas methanica]|uniref:Lcl C-terminal domain-containing protein n=3 Tax=Methylomonas TaxID=416 RepID=A0A126T2X4_9GAMM|nr:DUF1566 domain-containing protein [Methylomonas methanica]AMK76425.1 hypothetical protein JT25_007960 [Methylomonas denitrificans]OAH98684.1 hypothetical protein A1342_12700 [Methylomonas methanica]TCV88459.1 uncharacterized protein DUF1566 [Methylomonas methanica]
MKRKVVCAALAAFGTLAAGSAQAQLFDRGGGLIYDSVQNITWLADANYANTSGAYVPGKMSWQNAVAWVDGLSYADSVRGTTYSDWRLPTFHDLGATGCDYGYSSTDCGYNVALTSSELAHLFYGDFANKGFADSRGLPQPGYGLVDDPANPNDESLFSHIQSFSYWIGTSYNGDASKAWYLSTATGMQNYISKGSQFYVMAVRDGDVAAVPLPGAVWLFSSAFLGFLYSRRRGV